MTLDMSKPRGDRVLVPGANIDASPEPMFPDVVYYMVGKPNVFEVWGTVAGTLNKGGHNDAAKWYRDKAMTFETYDEVIEFTELVVNVLHLDSEEEIPR